MKNKKKEEPDGFGHIIAKIRRSKKISSGDFAKSIGISQVYLSQIERNKKIPSMALSKKIGEYFEVPFPVIMILSLQREAIPKKSLRAWKSLQPTIMSLIKSVFLPEK